MFYYIWMYIVYFESMQIKWLYYVMFHYALAIVKNLNKTFLCTWKDDNNYRGIKIMTLF